MSGFGNPGGLLLILAYFFIFQGVLALFIWQLKEEREKLLNLNILIGVIPLIVSIERVLSNYVLNAWSSGTSIFTYFCICSILNIFFWMLSFLSKKNLINLRWYFFVYINVIGGWIFSILI